MAIAEMLSRVMNRHRSRAAIKVGSFAGLVKSLASGGEPSDEEIDRALDESGKTPEDLANAIEILGYRNILADLKQSEIEWKRLSDLKEAAMTRANEERQAAMLRYQQRFERSREANIAIESQQMQTGRLQAAIEFVVDNPSKLDSARRKRIADLESDVQRRRLEITRLTTALAEEVVP